METSLDPQLLTLSEARADYGSFTVQAAATSLTGFYAGTVIASSPEYLPALDLNLVLNDSNGNLNGYLDSARTLNYPVVDQGSDNGPAVSGAWSGDSFNLQSQVFTTTLDSGLTISRSVLLHNGVVGNSGEKLSGQYSETMMGLTPQPLEITGVFTLWRAPTELPLGANFTAFPVAGTAPLFVTFTDLSSGDPDSWTWDFGDGTTSTGKEASHIYRRPGSYTVTLTVTKDRGSNTLTKSNYISVKPPTAPVADFMASTLSGPAPLNITFTDLSSGDPSSWAWSFGDGGTSTAQNPVYTYTLPGLYTVTLTASNAQGSHSLTKANYISVTAAPPVANFSASPVVGTAPLTVTFTDESTGGPTSWAWTFGDGGSSTEQHPSHTYVDTGAFTVTLTVSNAAGSDTMVYPACVNVTAADEQPIYLPLIFKDSQ